MKAEASKERKLREHNEVYSKQLETELENLKVRGHTGALTVPPGLVSCCLQRSYRNQSQSDDYQLDAHNLNPDSLVRWHSPSLDSNDFKFTNELYTQRVSTFLFYRCTHNPPDLSRHYITESKTCHYNRFVVETQEPEL